MATERPAREFGMVKTRGWMGGLEAAKAMIGLERCLIGSEDAGDGLVTVTARGRPDAVREAVLLGAQAARRVGELVLFAVPRPPPVSGRPRRPAHSFNTC
ncbi:MAG: BMC domain-containing protein [Deltaproteobacteria bacterium]|nr:BMC domain-containing protein [Deltaproteobacteria bacterium]